MSDDYEYFSDDENEKLQLENKLKNIIQNKSSHNNNNNNNNRNNNIDDDEQQTQKENSKLEQLESEIHHLKQEMTVLKHENEYLKKQHNYKQDMPNDHLNDILPPNEAHLLHDHEYLTHEIIRLKHIIKELQTKSNEKNEIHISEKLLEAFNKLIINFSLPYELKHKENQKDEYLIDIIKHVSKNLTHLIKQSETNINGTDSELVIKIRNLQDELRLALNAAEDIRALKGKLIQMIERVRVEKELKIKADLEAANFRKKTEMLTDHMEKLMAHLRHEASTKLRLLKQLSESEELNRNLKLNYSVLLKKNSAKDRFIVELHEGSKVLEDQLKLMDEKYLNLRSKLDYAREYGSRKLAKSDKLISELRSKFTMITGSNILLDNVKIPNNLQNTDYDSLSQNSSVSFDLRSSDTLGSTTSKSTKRNNTNKLKPIKIKTPQEEQQQLDVLLERINRKATGGPREWSEDAMRDLVKSR